jgi:tetratricopeptide (TPR) repeat protein
MSEELLIAKVQILMQQNRFADAEEMVKDLLRQDTTNVMYLALLAETQMHQDRFEVAEKIINDAIGLAPDDAHLYYMKARVDVENDKYDDAEANLQRAISLAPEISGYVAYLGHLKLLRKQYQQALELADRALELDAEDLTALNVRSSALLKLERVDEAYTTVEGALREDPNNAYTHANYGWSLLEKGDRRAAMEHFREALKNDPGYEYAQEGMKEALKAGNPVYRLYLKYSFWIGNLTARYQWAVIIGFYFGTRFLNTLANNNPEWAPFLTPLTVLLAIVAFSTWVIKPIGNLFLRFNKYGQVLLTEKQKMSSNLVAVAFGAFVAGGILYLITYANAWLGLTVFGFAMMLPLGVVFYEAKPKYALPVYTVVMAGTGVVAVGLAFISGELYNTASVAFMWEFVAFQWVANFLFIQRDNL